MRVRRIPISPSKVMEWRKDSTFCIFFLLHTRFALKNTMLQTSHSCSGKLQLALLLMIIMLNLSTRYTQGNDCEDDSKSMRCH